MTHLRLHRDSEDEAAAPEPIPFPSQRDERFSVEAETVGTEEDEAIDITRSLEQSLDNVQRRLDEVRDQLHDAFAFPGEDDWPPSAA